MVVRNQFGEMSLIVKDPEYLLAPASKNQSPQSPNPPGIVPDHFKCYQVEGGAPPFGVILTDQFGTYSAAIIKPVYLCNPVEKELQNGSIFFISKPNEHLVCYEINIPAPPGITLDFQDQFATETINLVHIPFLCVPSEKDEVVQVEDSSWGKMKSIYR